MFYVIVKQLHLFTNFIKTQNGRQTLYVLNFSTHIENTMWLFRIQNVTIIYTKNSSQYSVRILQEMFIQEQISSCKYSLNFPRYLTIVWYSKSSLKILQNEEEKSILILGLISFHLIKNKGTPLIFPIFEDIHIANPPIKFFKKEKKKVFELRGRSPFILLKTKGHPLFFHL